MNRKADVRALIVLLLAMLLGLLLPHDRAGAMTPDDIFSMRTAGVADLDSTGRRLLYTIGTWNRQTGRRESSLYLRDLGTGRDLLLLTEADPGRGARWLPDGGAISYLVDGDAGTEIWLMDPDGGNRRLLGVPGGRIGSLQWSPDGEVATWIAPAAAGEYCGDPERWVVADDLGYRHLGDGYREGKLRRLHIYDVASGEVLPVVTDSLDVHAAAWSPDGAHLVLSAKRRADLNRNLNTDLWLIGRDGEGLRLLTRNPGGDDQPVWLPDDRVAYLRATDPLWESAPRAVAVMDPDTGEDGGLVLRAEDFDNMVRRLAVMGDRIFVTGANRGCLDVFEVRDDGVRPVTAGGHDFWSLRGAGGRLVMTGAGQTLPGAVFILDVRATGGQPRTPDVIIDPNRQWRQRVDLVDPEPFTMEVDGRAIEGWYFRPPALDPGHRAPLVLSIHGGPEWMYGGYFLPEFHILPTFGYGVLIANPTGSTGYGYEFQNGVRGDWVGRPARELLACVDFAVARGWADSTALAVMGGSYGGHLAAALTTQTDRFKAAAVDRMFPDLVAFWGTTDEKWFPEWEFFGRPWEPRAREVYRRNSPTLLVDRVTTPTLISHGMEDYRCLIAGAEMWFSSLQALGVPSRFIRFLHEGHGIRDPRDQVFYQRQLLAFFDRHVLRMAEGDEAEDPGTEADTEPFPRNE